MQLLNQDTNSTLRNLKKKTRKHINDKCKSSYIIYRKIKVRAGYNIIVSIEL